jgi:hypothetical protein
VDRRGSWLDWRAVLPLPLDCRVIRPWPVGDRLTVVRVLPARGPGCRAEAEPLRRAEDELPLRTEDDALGRELLDGRRAELPGDREALLPDLAELDPDRE